MIAYSGLVGDFPLRFRFFFVLFPIAWRSSSLLLLLLLLLLPQPLCFPHLVCAYCFSALASDCACCPPSHFASRTDKSACAHHSGGRPSESG
ncbi:uncharacterized protein K452DRAFT_352414 [Aplosporella prunicola CBS 121167]|uniref:Uncharacterized protein n=1 Tax=Aplosporella prunicola CBS 121167 TaxID=1176127 RepID=A0A6A6B6G2_9PEZI|nr:uncharacterized protein K452DRAFT_352414 [Aplosporella prunicola CBS 121167]KAF2139600.1 hypothetical protein K452DRAFT_352414 [Aplosporella prunicola CBS 121167]